MKLCTVCGVVTSRAGSRCTQHTRASNRSRHNALYSTRAWQRLSARVLRAWRGEHGNWCPGYQRPSHPAADLTVDHVVPLAAGGSPFDIANTAVLCRSCNSTKGASTDRGGVDPRTQYVPPDRRRVVPGSVLYLALEDGKRRGQDRLRAALAGRTMPRGRLEIRWDARQIGAGLEEDIADWLDEHADAVLVAIDTLGKVRGATDGRRNAYEVDVAAMARLQDLFRDRSVALVIVHHARKESTDDFLTSVSGTYGITGSADTIVVIRRKRNEAFGTLHVTGRDVADEEITARFDDLTWTAAPGALSAASFERGEVYRVIEARGPVFPKSIADELGMERTSVQHLVTGLVGQGAVARVRGGYVAAEVVIETAEPLSLPLHSTHSKSEERGGGHAPAGAREASPVLRVVPADPTGWANPCHWYRDHQSKHRQTPSGWTCDACYPEEGPIA